MNLNNNIFEEFLKRKNKRNIILFLIILLLILLFLFFRFSFNNKTKKIENSYKLDKDRKFIPIKKCSEIKNKNDELKEKKSNIKIKKYKLKDFHICSSYNSSLIGNQKNDYVSLEMLKKVILSGARYLELEIIPSKLGEFAEPLVGTGLLNGNWTTSINSIDFKEVLILLDKYAFTKNINYPLLIYLNFTNKNTYLLNKVGSLIRKNNLLKQNKLLENIKKKYNINDNNIILEDLCNLNNKIIFISSLKSYELEEFDILNNIICNNDLNNQIVIKRIYYNEVLKNYIYNKNIGLTEDEYINKTLDYNNIDYDNDRFNKDEKYKNNLINYKEKIDILEQLKKENYLYPLMFFNKIGFSIIIPHKEEDKFTKNYNYTIFFENGCNCISLNFQDNFIDKKSIINNYINLFKKKNSSLILKPENLRNYFNNNSENANKNEIQTDFKNTSSLKIKKNNNIIKLLKSSNNDDDDEEDKNENNLVVISLYNKDLVIKNNLNYNESIIKLEKSSNNNNYSNKINNIYNLNKNINNTISLNPIQRNKLIPFIKSHRLYLSYHGDNLTLKKYDNNNIEFNLVEPLININDIYNNFYVSLMKKNDYLNNTNNYISYNEDEEDNSNNDTNDTNDINNYKVLKVNNIDIIENKLSTRQNAVFNIQKIETLKQFKNIEISKRLFIKNNKINKFLKYENDIFSYNGDENDKNFNNLCGFLIKIVHKINNNKFIVNIKLNKYQTNLFKEKKYLSISDENELILTNNKNKAILFNLNIVKNKNIFLSIVKNDIYKNEFILSNLNKKTYFIKNKKNNNNDIPFKNDLVKIVDIEDDLFNKLKNKDKNIKSKSKLKLIIFKVINEDYFKPIEEKYDYELMYYNNKNKKIIFNLIIKFNSLNKNKIKKISIKDMNTEFNCYYKYIF